MTAEASGSARIFQAAGDQTIYDSEPPYHLRKVPHAAPVPDIERLILQPSRMLRTHFEVVPFRGRETEVNQLKKWRDAPPNGTSVQLIYGAGGQGKTRLATHLARTWADDRWITLRAFPHDELDGPEAIDLIPKSAVQGILIIVDYAERWETTNLLALLRHAADPTGVPVRVLLLARPAGTWWQTLAHRLEKDFDVIADAILLPPLGETPDERLELFKEARDRFAQILRVDNPQYICPLQVLRLIRDMHLYLRRTWQLWPQW